MLLKLSTHVNTTKNCKIISKKKQGGGGESPTVNRGQGNPKLLLCFEKKKKKVLN